MSTRTKIPMEFIRPKVKVSKKQQAYLEEQARRGMIDVDTPEFRRSEKLICQILEAEGDNYPELIAQAGRISQCSCEATRTVMSNLGWGCDERTEKALKAQFSSTYKRPEKL